MEQKNILYIPQKVDNKFTCEGCDMKGKDCINIMPIYCIDESCIFVKNNKINHD